MTDSDFERRVSTSLQDAYRDVEPCDELRVRVGALTSATVDGAVPAVEAVSRRDERSRKQWLFASAALVAAAIVALAVVVARGSSSDRQSVSRPVPAKDLIARCDAPSTRFVRFEVLTAGGPLTDYSHTVRLGSREVPEFTMFFSHGAPGAGVLCLSALASFDDSARHPIITAVTPGSGAIAYLGKGYGEPYGAVRPGVVRVTIDVAGSPGGGVAYTIGNENSPLRPMGFGWHAFNADHGFWDDPAVLVVTSYDARGRTVGTARMKIDNGSRLSAAPTSR